MSTSVPRNRVLPIVLSGGIVILGLLAWIVISLIFPKDFPPKSAVVSIDQTVIESTETAWPQLRGPTFDSYSTETGLAESWPEAGPPVVWTRELGQGYSGFIAVGNRVYTQTQSLYRQSLVCLDAETGATVWTHHYGWPYDGGGLYPGPRSTPTWHEGRIYFAAPEGTIGCVDAETGTAVWSWNPKTKYRGRGTDFGYASSPVIIDGRLVLPIGGLDASVIALDPNDGSVLWTSGESSASYATPLPIRWHGRSLVITPLENSLAAFDVATGVHEWEVEFSTGYDEHSAAPIYREPFLMLASPFKAGAKQYRLDVVTNSSVSDISADPQEKGKAESARSNARDSAETSSGSERLTPVVVWETPRFSNDVASSVLVDGRVYGFDLKDPQSRLDRPSRGEFRCIDFDTGRILWSTNKVGQANIIVADDKLILLTDSGELILSKPGTEEYTELARVQVFRDENCWTYPALHRGCIYLRTQTRAACLYLGQADRPATRGARSVRDIPRGQTLDAKWLIGGEREFPATVPDWDEFRTWYQWSLAGLVLGSVVAALSISLKAPVLIARTIFWLFIGLTGVFGSPVINSRQDEYVLLWPLVLWAAYQWAINSITWAERSDNRFRARWVSRGCGLSFIAVSLLYFHLCRSLGYAIEWSFLVGFLPAFPVAAVAARFLTTRPRFWPALDLIVSVISFSAFFWSSVIFIKWKLVVGS